MPDLQQTRRKVKIGHYRQWWCFAFVALVVLFSPLVGSTASRKEQMAACGSELKSKNQQVEPLRGMDKKVAIRAGADSRTSITPVSLTRGSEIYEELGKIQAQTGAQDSGNQVQGRR